MANKLRQQHPPSNTPLKIVPQLNLDNLADPMEMKKELEEKKAEKRGPKLDENLRLKICDLGNGCWTYHHFASEI